MGLFGKKKNGDKSPPKPEPPKPSFGTVRSGSPAPPPGRPRADFGNVQSGSSSTAPPAPPPPEPAHDTYVVQSGDSLSKIAKQFYGKASQWPKIHEANRDLIENPDRIQIGWTLKIPKS